MQSPNAFFVFDIICIFKKSPKRFLLYWFGSLSVLNVKYCSNSRSTYTTFVANNIISCWVNCYFYCYFMCKTPGHTTILYCLSIYAYTVLTTNVTVPPLPHTLGPRRSRSRRLNPRRKCPHKNYISFFHHTKSINVVQSLIASNKNIKTFTKPLLDQCWRERKYHVIYQV